MIAMPHAVVDGEAKPVKLTTSPSLSDSRLVPTFVSENIETPIIVTLKNHIESLYLTIDLAVLAACWPNRSSASQGHQSFACKTDRHLIEAFSILF